MSKSLKDQIVHVQEWQWMTVEQDRLRYTLCCDCNLRHIEEYRIVKDKKGKLVIQWRASRDDFATDLLRAYEKKAGKP